VVKVKLVRSDFESAQESTCGNEVARGVFDTQEVFGDRNFDDKSFSI